MIGMGRRGLGFVAAVIGIGALLLVTMPRTEPPEPQAVALAPTPSTSVAPAAPTASTQPSATAGRTAFISSVHQYAFMLPPDWTARDSKDAATPDRFDGPEGRVLAVQHLRLPEGGATNGWLSEHVPFRADPSGSCVSDATFDATPTQLDDSYVGDIDARLRLSCWYVDAVATTGDRAWLVSLQNPTRRDADIVLFRLLTDTFRSLPDPDATPPTPRPHPMPTPTVPPDWLSFTSTHHGYSLQYPPEWTAQPALSRDMVDVYIHGQNDLAVDRRSVPELPSVVAWANATMPDRAGSEGDSRLCIFRQGGGSTMIPAPSRTFRSTVILGWPAAIRSMCSYVDAVIDLGDTVLVLSQDAAGKMREGNDELFAQFVAGLRLAEDD